MFISKISRTALVAGVVGIAALAAATQASAFGGFGGGNGGFGGGRGMGGAGFDGGGMRPMSANLGGQRPMGGLGGGMGGHRPGGMGQGGMGGHRPGQMGQGGRPGRIECFRAPCNVGGGDHVWNHRPPTWKYPPNQRPPYWNCHWTHSCGGPRPVSCRFYPYASFCGWRPPVYRTVYYPRPVYSAPVYTAAYRAPVYTAPAAAPAPVCVQPGPYISVIFQTNVTAGDMAGFLNTYNVQMADGPSNDGVFKLKLSAPLPPDQLNSMLDSMRGQTNVVSQVNG